MRGALILVLALASTSNMCGLVNVKNADIIKRVNDALLAIFAGAHSPDNPA
jgi:hypothetical protein